MMCKRCGRPLQGRAMASAGALQETPYGPRCRRRVLVPGRALLASPNAAARRAGQALLQGTFQRVPGKEGRPVWVFPSGSQPGRTWVTTRDGCSCPAGDSGRLCYHQAVVVVLTTA